MNYESCKKEFISTVNSMSGRYSVYQVFSDFCEMAAISLNQPFAKSAELEEKYLKIIGKYRKEDVDNFPKLLAHVVNGLSDEFGDFLGECYMSLEISNKHSGQFFTPYSISKFMTLLLGENIKEKEYFSEPAAGSGGMIIARADAMKEKGINYQQLMEVQAVDLDKMCFHMCYIHLALLHISAEVIWGNSLSLEIFETWYTPAHYMNGGRRCGFDYLKKGTSPERSAVPEKVLPLPQEVKGPLVQGSLF